MGAKRLPLAFLPVRILFFFLAAMFNRMDMSHPRFDIGMPKNYRVVMRKPTRGIQPQ
jgi:hypothetical protein